MYILRQHHLFPRLTFCSIYFLRSLFITTWFKDKCSSCWFRSIDLSYVSMWIMTEYRLHYKSLTFSSFWNIQIEIRVYCWNKIIFMAQYWDLQGVFLLKESFWHISFFLYIYFFQGQVEEDLKALDFERLTILRPSYVKCFVLIN